VCASRKRERDLFATQLEKRERERLFCVFRVYEGVCVCMWVDWLDRQEEGGRVGGGLGGFE